MSRTLGLRDCPIRVVGIAIAVVVTVGTLSAAGSLTNWFRYPLSLEATFALVPLGIAAPVAVALAWFGLRLRSWWLAALAAVSMGAGAVLFVWAHQEALGASIPSASRDHVESSGIATLLTREGALQYRLDLYSPFAEQHREVLTIVQSGRTYHFDLPIFDEPTGGYAGALAPSDWIVLSATPDPHVFDVSLGDHLSTEKSFTVNLRTGEVTPGSDG